jgi:hypothetical protein
LDAKRLDQAVERMMDDRITETARRKCSGISVNENGRMRQANGRFDPSVM